MYEDNFKNGKLDGKKINWNKNGQKESETNYKDGILIL
jgi:antitoxin component YwqK of YwqJK toxin-antitoxin module